MRTEDDERENDQMFHFLKQNKNEKKRSSHVNVVYSFQADLSN